MKTNVFLYRVGTGAVALSAFLVLPAAQASFTTVSAPPAGEATLATILSHVYGGVFAGMGHGAATYTNGTVIASRVDDTLTTGGPGSDLHLIFGAPGLPTTDQRWVDGIAATSAEAKFAGYSQEFGYDDGGGYVKLFDATMTGPTGFDVTGSATHDFASAAPWDWVRSGQGGPWYSSEATNRDTLDHLVTYRITGLSGIGASQAVWMLFWEDLRGPLGMGSDRDFNDLAVEITARVIPVPGAVALGALGLMLSGAWSRRRFCAA